MNRIESIFADQKRAGVRGLMPFVCGGYPRAGVLPRVLTEVERAGAGIVEIGFPFSDPIADGPVIAEAMHTALQRGATAHAVFDEIAAARPAVKLGLVGMVSVSIIWRLGIEPAVRHAVRAGLDGFIFPDLPAGEGDDLLARVRDAGLIASLLVAPTTPPQRAERIVRSCSGFVYLLARAGITGESSGPPDIADRVALLRTMTDLPIACGFGISTAGHVREVVRHADAAIVGSALVRRMKHAEESGADPAGAAGDMVRELAAGLS